MDYTKYESWMEELKSVGLVSETQLMHVRIISEFKDLRQCFKVESAEIKLADKYNLAPETIHKIVYKKCRLNRHPSHK